MSRPSARCSDIRRSPDRRIASGDRLAMQVLFARHHVRVYRFVLRLVRNESMAEDLISEVFLDVWRQAGRFEGRCCGFDLDARDREVQGSFGAARDAGGGTGRRDGRGDRGCSDDDPEVAMQKKDKSVILRKCLEALSPEHREIIDLVYYHEKSVEEVAEIVGIPENTVKTRMFYARKKLAELLEGGGNRKRLAMNTTMNKAPEREEIEEPPALARSGNAEPPRHRACRAGARERPRAGPPFRDGARGARRDHSCSTKRWARRPRGR